jgi:hypothetical protein
MVVGVEQATHGGSLRKSWMAKYITVVLVFDYFLVADSSLTRKVIDYR